jgi:hypothetical protein
MEVFSKNLHRFPRKYPLSIIMFIESKRKSHDTSKFLFLFFVLLSFRLILILQTTFAKDANLLFKNTDDINNDGKSAIIAYLVFHTFLKFKGEALPKGLIGLYHS